ASSLLRASSRAGRANLMRSRPSRAFGDTEVKGLAQYRKPGIFLAKQVAKSREDDGGGDRKLIDERKTGDNIGSIMRADQYPRGGDPYGNGNDEEAHLRKEQH